MPLTAHQNEKLGEGLEIITNSDRLLIEGSAGVGKTYLVNEFIKELKKLLPSNKEIYCTAPTNKAVAVLKGKVDNDLATFITLHSALKIRRVTDTKTGEVSFKPQYNEKDPPLKGVSILIADEGSMINTEMHEFLEYHANKMRVKIIYIGDIKQLNPVKESLSPIFLGKPYVFDDLKASVDFRTQNTNFELREYENRVVVYVPYPKIELTEIIRQKEDNPIIDLSRNLEVLKGYNDKTNMSFEGKLTGYMHTADRNKVISTLATVNGSDDLKYLSYTNKDVDSINSDVRKLIYGNPAKIELGESLIFDAPYKDLFHTNQEVKVNTLEIAEQEFIIPYNDKEDSIKLKFYVINGRKMDGKWFGVLVIHEAYEKRLKTLAIITKKACLNRNLSFRERDEFLGNFAETKYNHALTVHKSQGSTYKQVILNVSNINLNRDDQERKKLLYTGVTRASDLLIIYNK